MLSFSITSQAANYRFIQSGIQSPEYFAPDPSMACEDISGLFDWSAGENHWVESVNGLTPFPQGNDGNGSMQCFFHYERLSDGYLITSYQPLITYAIVCDAGGAYDPLTGECDNYVAPTCETLAGSDASGYGYYNANNFRSVACHSGCESIFNGNGPLNFPYSDTPDESYMLGLYKYSDVAFECSSGDSPTVPELVTAPVNTTTPPDVDPNDQGDCTSGWYLQSDGSCALTRDPSDPLSGAEANCDKGKYYVPSLGICLLYNQNTTTPGGGGTGDNTSGTQVESSGVDTDGDGETNDEGFCVQFPESPICKKSVYSSSNCDVKPVCKGDAIQCAIALDTWKIQCKEGLLDEIDPKAHDKLIEGADDFIANEKLVWDDFAEIHEGGKYYTEFDFPEIINLPALDTHVGSCPSIPSMTMNGASISLQPMIDPFCDFASIIALLANIAAGFIILYSIRMGLA